MSTSEWDVIAASIAERRNFSLGMAFSWSEIDQAAEGFVTNNHECQAILRWATPEILNGCTNMLMGIPVPDASVSDQMPREHPGYTADE